MIHAQLERALCDGRRTLLGIGPMSKNCVDATLRLAERHDAPFFLIASRRQIDSEEFGGGYVNHWTTASLSRYVTERNTKRNILLSRDHGGPWQNPLEVQEGQDLAAAMRSAKRSYETDIASGFSVIHIDPSISPHGTPNIDTVLERLFELYEFCCETAAKLGAEIVIEVGAEEQRNSANSVEELEYFATKITGFCAKTRLQPASFLVIQTGTRVVETRNVGVLQSWFEGGSMPLQKQILDLLRAAKNHGFWIKQHNTDYLPDDILALHSSLGIHAANVAPEFAVAETHALLQLCRDHGLDRLRETLLRTSYESRKWEKWMVSDSVASDFDRAVISAHYVFSNPEVESAKEEACSILGKKNICLDALLTAAVERSIERYIKNFRLATAV
jgi:tagatose-1,6-bisphosphate aldolase non-catalytic subunit AgaZ/GatZ